MKHICSYVTRNFTATKAQQGMCGQLAEVHNMTVKQPTFKHAIFCSSVKQ